METPQFQFNPGIEKFIKDGYFDLRGYNKAESLAMLRTDIGRVIYISGVVAIAAELHYGIRLIAFMVSHGHSAASQVFGRVAIWPDALPFLIALTVYVIAVYQYYQKKPLAKSVWKFSMASIKDFFKSKTFKTMLILLFIAFGLFVVTLCDHTPGKPWSTTQMIINAACLLAGLTCALSAFILEIRYMMNERYWMIKLPGQLDEYIEPGSKNMKPL